MNINNTRYLINGYYLKIRGSSYNIYKYCYQLNDMRLVKSISVCDYNNNHKRTIQAAREYAIKNGYITNYEFKMSFLKSTIEDHLKTTLKNKDK